MSWTPVTPKTWAAGDGTSAQMNTGVRDVLTNLNAANGSITTWTPVLTASTTNPTNYTGTGWYVLNGNLCTAWMNISTGASWTVGSGSYIFSLPVTADTTYGQQIIGEGWAIGGASVNTLMVAQQQSSTTFRVIYQSTLATAVSVLSHNLPAGLAVSTGNAIRAKIEFVVA